MRVKSYVIENREEFINELEKELCQNGISYVKIGYEFHFLDQIIRFYDFEIDKCMIINSFLMKESQKQMEKLEINLDDMPKKIDPFDLLVGLSYKDKHIDEYSKNYQRRNKFNQKQESIKVNQKLKRYR